jgi:hypothetical protein
MIGNLANSSMLIITTTFLGNIAFAEPKIAPAPVEEVSRPQSASHATRYRSMSIRAPVIKDVPDHAEELEQEQAAKTSQSVDATLEPRAPEDTMQ